MRDDVTDRQTLTIEEARQVLGISRGSAYEAARTGALPVIRIGKRMLVPKSALDRLLADPQAIAGPKAVA